MQNTIQGVCPACGNLFSIASSGNAIDDVACTFCGKKINIVSHSSVHLQAVDGSMTAALVNSSAALSGTLAAVTELPAAPKSAIGAGIEDVPEGCEPYVPGAPNEPEVPLVTTAWNACQEQGWACQNWPGLNAFAVEAVLDPGKKSERRLSVSISGGGGMLNLETVVAPLPRPPFTPLREVLCRVNVRSGGTIFMIRDCGVVARYKLWPRVRRDGNVSRNALLRAINQLDRDAHNGETVLKESAIRMCLANPTSIDQAFAVPLAASSGLPNLRQFEAFGKQAGYVAVPRGAMIYLGPEPSRPNYCPVWVSVSKGVLRGFTVPGSQTGSKENTGIWGVFSKMVGRADDGANKLSKSQLDALLKKIDELNEIPGLMNYAWNGKQVLAMVIFSPTESNMDLEEFQQMAEFLFERALTGIPDLSSPTGVR